MLNNEFKLSAHQLKSFEQNGYLVIPNTVSGTQLKDMQQLADSELSAPKEPKELEAQLGYPGAPSNINTSGGTTVRRLLAAYQRNALWRQWATSNTLKNYLSQLLKHQHIYLSQAHHNCLMTKTPTYSSDTGWHQDIRYWSFKFPELVTAWLALGQEVEHNGGLKVIPGSHRLQFTSEQFDSSLFFRTDLALNRNLIQQSHSISLNPGDLLFFHCKLLHSASRNHSERTKYSLVFTYRSGNNAAILGSRSAGQNDIAL
ncbi:phytanoyl-CoA dioxygenase family protein [Aliikangiella sp. IMCC44359]|uniref:phytanoyl-CoA dioxygenase family protein n=1 Tax=Aliikangiella sp. IMCC44359 TaxID=3459125 RepID=UPI00403AC965